MFYNKFEDCDCLDYLWRLFTLCVNISLCYMVIGFIIPSFGNFIIDSMNFTSIFGLWNVFAGVTLMGGICMHIIKHTR